MKALFDSIVRTFTPLIVGAVIGWFVTAGITLDPEFEGALTLVVSGAFALIYYVGARVLETYVAPRFGWLLGVARQPIYASLPDASTSTREAYQAALDPHRTAFRNRGAHNE